MFAGVSCRIPATLFEMVVVVVALAKELHRTTKAIKNKIFIFSLSIMGTHNQLGHY
jgi:hypothetical protein